MFLWDSQGRVVTNDHVVREADAAQVRLGDGGVWDAELVGAAPDFDVAVLRINAPTQPRAPLAIGRSHDLEVGQKIFAIGNPFGLDPSALPTPLLCAVFHVRSEIPSP